MKAVWRIFQVALLALALGVSANATPFIIIGGTAGTIPGGIGVNDYGYWLPTGPPIGGYYGSQIDFSLPMPLTLTIEFYGAEAVNDNAFFYPSSTSLFTHTFDGTLVAPSLASPLATVLTILSGSGTLDFKFTSGVGSVVNGSNPDNSGGNVTTPNFFASCDPTLTTAGGPTTCSTIYLFLDDGSGPGLDDDYDDLLVRLTAVPEPASFALVGIGLLAWGLHRRLRA